MDSDRQKRINEVMEAAKEEAYAVAEEHLKLVEHMRKYIEMFDSSIELVEQLAEMQKTERGCECCCPCKKKSDE